jgi:hypothetical protein
MQVMGGDVGSFSEEMDRRIGEVFAAHPELDDHRGEFPWLTGWLGDPSAAVWLVAENPSATQVSRIHDGEATVEYQWAASRGDRLLRETLVDLGLKDGDPFSPGGWRCYLTDVMKSKVFVRDWNGAKSAEQLLVAEAWAPVLSYELEVGDPAVLVTLGGNADKAVRHLRRRRLIPGNPPTVRVAHYSYVMMRPQGQRPPGDLGRQREWKQSLRDAIGRHVGERAG